MVITRQRYQGSLLGLAAGDAVGTTVEFRPPGTFAPVTDLVGGGPFDLEPRQWTEDTSMALCLAECGGFASLPLWEEAAGALRLDHFAPPALHSCYGPAAG